MGYKNNLDRTMMVDDLSEGHVYYGLTRYWLYCKRAFFPFLLLRMDRWLDLNNYSTVIICICPKEFDCQKKKTSQSDLTPDVHMWI